ncbi:MAG: hypothetical protein HKN99_05770, partial [Winogradskyella sp.]|nr:hypothetical protein [Winogradskyella sp.]
MKKLVYFGLILLLIACKNEKKQSEPTNVETPEVISEKVIAQLPISGIENWQLQDASIS